MEKRVFLAIFLSFIVLVIYQAQFAPPPPQPPAQSPAAAATGGGSGPGAAQAAGATGTVPVGTPPPTVPVATPIISDASARDVVVETDSLTATFNTRGAVLTSYKLKGYPDDAGKPLELIPQDLPAANARAFTISTDNEQESATLAAALYQPSADSLSIGSGSGAITFLYRDDSGLDARKTFTFGGNGRPFLVNIEASVTASGTPRPVTIRFGPGIGPGYAVGGGTFTAPRALQMRAGEVERLNASALQTQSRYEGAILYAGVDDHYFLSAALPPAGDTIVEYQPITMPIPGNAQGASRTLVAFSLRPKQATPAAVSVPFFIGPKDFDTLRAAEKQLVYAIDFGMFDVIIVPLLQALKGINRYLHNYGWSIVVLTIIINIVLFPLRHRSMVSMKKMQAIQPEMKAIQDRYAKYKATDPEKQKMNQEIWQLYKSKGVNPASGCVPMLLTMPVLLAFYSLLSQAIELRGAPFMLWIQDLSARDPYYVFPILMGATMFWQQKMMPAGADPVQRRIFLALPIVFTFLFLGMPSGLVIYWMVSNILTIGQQVITNRIMGGKVPVRAAAVPRKG